MITPEYRRYYRKTKPGKWRRILVDDEGRVIISPESFEHLIFKRAEDGMMFLLGGVDENDDMRPLRVNKDGRAICSPPESEKRCWRDGEDEVCVNVTEARIKE